MKIKNKQLGFISIVLTVIISLVLIGGGVYVYKNISDAKKIEQQTNNIATTTTTQNEKKEPVDTIPVVETETKTELAVNTPIPKTGITTNVDVSSSTVTTCSDSICFASAIELCKPAKYGRSTISNILGSISDTTFDFEVEKVKNDCDLKVILRKISIRPSDQLLQDSKTATNAGELNMEQTYQQTNKQNQLFISKVGVCSLDINMKKTLATFFKRGKQDPQYGDGWLFFLGDNNSCNGGIFVDSAM